ncbi:MAG: hypothetical protein ACC645_13345, partial [Pirellulales bacterium]
ARHPDHFIFLFHSFPRLLWPKGTEVDGQRNVEHPVWQDDNPYVHGVRHAIDAMARHLKSLGIGYDRWAFYPLDEPWNTGATLIPELRRFCSLVKKVHPKARNYTDPTGGVRWRYLEEFRDLVDIWQCGRNALCADPELLQWFRDNAKTFWYYEAPGLAKELLPLGHYRTHGWLGWRFGTSGHGFWVYNRQDLWWGRPHGGYNAVYANGSDVVTSRRWEAERDGLEDWRALYVLREEIEKALASDNSARAQAAQSLLDESVESVTSFQVEHINQVNRFILDYELDFEMLTDFRSRIATAIIGLREATAEE